jgi:uncharacterized protein (TIGR00251 family)
VSPAREAVIEVEVTPGAPRSQIKSRTGGTFRAAVAAEPQKGRANRELVKLLAKTLDVRRSQIRITRGAHSRKKRLRITGVSASEVERKLEGAART